MKFKKTLLLPFVIGSCILSVPYTALANDSDEVAQLRKLVEELDQKIRILERKGEVAEEAAIAEKQKNPPVKVKASNSGFSFESADGKNIIKLRGLLQADYRSYQEGANDVRNRSNQRAGTLDTDGFHDATDTWLLRRARPTIEGTLFGQYDFRFTPEFAGGSASAVDAYIDARFLPEFKVRAGKFKTFAGLERLQSGSDIKFLERSYVTNAILPNRDLGVAVHGDLFSNRLNYAVGLMNGVTDGGNTSTGTEFNEDKEYTGRLFATPFSNDITPLTGLGFGFAATFQDASGERNLNFTDTSAADGTRNGLPSYLTPGQQTFFRYNSAAVADGERLRISPQAYYYYGPLGIIGEYAQVDQDVSLTTGGSASGGGAGTNTVVTSGTKKKLTHDAWQIAATWLLTGEDVSFKGVKPKRDFNFGGGWGAWELAGRYSEINLDDDTFKDPTGTVFTGAYADLSNSASAAHTWTAGLNWYLNPNVKVAFNYEHTSFDGGAGDGILPIDAAGTTVRDRDDERAFLTRFQIGF